MKKIRTPIIYPGSKDEYVIKRILPLIPKHTHYIEPFCGGASIFFAKPKSKLSWLNDINSELINTYKMLRDKPEELIEEFKNAEISERNYDYFKNRMQPVNSLGRALKWLYLDFNSYPATINLIPKYLKFDMAKQKNIGKLSEKLYATSEKLQDVKLTTGDFINVIRLAPKGSFLFIDPPYSLHNSHLKSSRYIDKFEKRDHKRLASSLKKKSKDIKFMLCYKVDEDAERLYTITDQINKQFLTFETNHLVFRDEKVMMKRQNYSEMIFTNYKI